jgi:hypothetical protein
MEAGAHFHQDPRYMTGGPVAGAVPGDVKLDSGWVDFAGVLLFIAGMMDVLWGIVAFANKSFFIQGGLVWEHLSTWAWILLIGGAIECVTGGLVLARKGVGRWMAIGVVVVAIFVNFLSLGAYPVWSVLALGANALVLWAVTTHKEDFR